MTCRATITAALMLVLVLSAACGVKSPPFPADVLLPDRVSGLGYEFAEDGRLIVSFRPPTKNVEGLPLEDLGGFLVERSENRLDSGFCPGCPVRYDQRFRIPAVKPPARLSVAQVTYRFEDRLTEGYVYHYRVLAYDSDEQLHPGRERTLAVQFGTPCRPPDAIDVETDDKVVVLRWPPSDSLVDGRPATDLAGYNLYRQQGLAEWSRVNVDRPWENTVYEDTQVINGTTYFYKIRSVRKRGETLIEGPPSPIVAAIPLDLTPPPPPVKVGAASTKKGVSLSWGRIDAPDLAGYRVYRRAQNQARFERIGPELITRPLFVDAEVKPGRVYYYRITAVDGAPAANESEWTREVQIRYEP
ncbi:MAG: hypothetical protein KKB20_08405 [Proteobacteria bacterium]|nr:hypothetical protein [Pseudomonadota bacterium]